VVADITKVARSAQEHCVIERKLPRIGLGGIPAAQAGMKEKAL
jgi:hypothetical protein